MGIASLSRGSSARMNWFAHGDPNDPYRHIGLGQPLIGTSWRNRPIYFGAFVGGIMMDDIVPNRIYLKGRDGIEVEAASTSVLSLRDGKIVSHRLYLEKKDALEAVGLSE